MGEFFKMAWHNMWRNWRRTAIAASAIVLGLILMLFIEGMIRGSDQGIYGNSVRLYGGNVQVHAPGFRPKADRLPLLPLENPDAVVATLQAEPGVVSVAKRISTGGLVSTRAGSFPVKITAIEPAVEEPHSLQAENITAGRFLLENEGDAVVIGQGLADELKVTAGDRVTLVGRSKQENMRQRSMTVVGIFDLGMADAEKGLVFITLPEAQSLYGLRDQATEVAVLLDTVGQENTVLPQYAAALPNYEVDSWMTLNPEIGETLAMKSVFTNIFGLVVLMIAGIGILNLMLMAVFERTREMGVLAALGMKSRQIMGLFLLEGAMIGAGGGLIGGILGWAVVWAVGQVGFDLSYASGMGEMTALMGSRLYPSITFFDVAWRWVAVTLIATLAALFPAWQAARKEPAAALHHI